MPPQSHSHNAGSFQRCTGKGSCGYQWTWADRSTCFGCSKQLWTGFQPAQVRPPAGAWASPKAPYDRSK
eukprot:12924808-Heterocapsa_arctica.AAC.1